MLVTQLALEGRLQIRVWRGDDGAFHCAVICELPVTANQKSRMGENHPLHTDSGGTAMKSALLELLCGEKGRDAAPWFRERRLAAPYTVQVTNLPGARVMNSEPIGARPLTGPERWLLSDGQSVGRLYGKNDRMPQHLIVDVAGAEVHITRAWLQRALDQFTE